MDKKQIAEKSKSLGIGDISLPDSRDFGREIELIRQETKELRQIFHDRGLEIGMPAQLNYDISRIAGILTSMINDLPDNATEQQKSEESDITNEFKKGNYVLAFHKMQILKQKNERKLYEIKAYLNILVHILSMFQSRLMSHEGR